MANRASARLGVARFGAMRLGYCEPWIKVLINGVVRTDDAWLAESSITHLLNHEPDTCSLRVTGTEPLKGQEVKVYCGDTDLQHQLFGGRILNVDVRYVTLEDGSRLVVYDLSCVDYTWLLNRRKVIKKYTSQSASTIAANLITTYTSGFTTNHVATGLATIDEITFTNEDVTDALSRLAERIGGYWYIDYANDLHFFLTESASAASITTAAPRGASEIRQSIDLSQIATRVIVRGGGSNASADVGVGATRVPVEDPSWYSASGGTVECGPQVITYTGVVSTIGSSVVLETSSVVEELGSETGHVEASAASAMVVTTDAGQGAGSMDASATYGFALTYVTDEGESLPSATVFGTSKSNGSIYVESIPVPTDPKITAKKLYRTDGGGGGGLRFTEDLTVAETAVPNFQADFDLGAAVPTSNTAGYSSVVIPAGSTSLRVQDLAQFPASGWAVTGAGQVFSYSGRSASSGEGYLTGIPASGAGSLTHPVRAGTVRVARTVGSTTIRVADLAQFPASGSAITADGAVFTYTGRSASSGAGYLTGIPASGAGAFVEPVYEGAIRVVRPAGSSTLRVEDLAQFPASGMAITAAGAIFTYSGRSASSGIGYLTGVGSLTAPVYEGAIYVVPHLSGVSGVLYAINKGDQVNVRVTRNNTAAQTALAALVGGDGIHEVFLSDGRLSITECEARGDAELALSKDPLTTVTYTTRDQTHNVGCQVTFNTTTPTITGTYTIQSVTFSEIGITGGLARVWPKRTVLASSRRFSFADILRQIKGQ